MSGARGVVVRLRPRGPRASAGPGPGAERLRAVAAALGVAAGPRWAYAGVADALVGRPGPGFDPFATFVLDVPAGDAPAVADALAAHPDVAHAYVEPRVFAASAARPPPPRTLADLHTLLGADADAPGAGGSGTTLLVVEEGFALPHPALPPPEAMGGLGDLGFASPHGTMSLGITSTRPPGPAASAGAPGAGLAPDAAIVRAGLGVTYGSASRLYAALLAVQLAAAALPRPRATVVLLAQQLGDWVGRPDGGAPRLYSGLPLDVDPELRALLRLLAAGGRVVVLAAGNGGGPDLDTVAFSRANGEPGPCAKLPRAGPLRVGAAFVPPAGPATAPLVRGRARVHAYAPADGVLVPAADGGFSAYTGSSAATAIVAGIVLSLQGRRLAAGRPPLPATKLRVLLSEERGHGLVVHGPDGAPLGRVPDLSRLVTDPIFRG